MKRSRSRQYLERLTRWYDPWRDLRHQSVFAFEREISIEDAKRLYGFVAHELAILRDPTKMMGAATCSCGKFARTFTIIDPKVEDHALAWLQNEHDKHTKAVP